MTAGIHEKYDHLQEILRGLGRVAVAFSGGIDSTFLLSAACDALGKDTVVALHGVSCLLPAHSPQAEDTLFDRYFSGKARLRRITLRPLLWDEFVGNTFDRCYFCKKRIYSIFLKELESEGGGYSLIDGTNVDDLKDDRPGLRALKELGIQTPLVMAGFHKPEIRFLARERGLENHDQPSNSCLATRIATGVPIRAEALRLIDDAEHFLHQKGFFGCRVRPGAERTIIEIRSEDLERITLREMRESLIGYFQSVGLPGILLDLHGRDQ